MAMLNNQMVANQLIHSNYVQCPSHNISEQHLKKWWRLLQAWSQYVQGNEVDGDSIFTMFAWKSSKLRMIRQDG
jgi:hypothetical protein